jgi:putative acetyltransferase
VRPEAAGDVGAVRAVHLAAFPSSLESTLVDALRGAGKAVISLVADDAARIVGHVLFSTVSVERTTTRGLGLAPVSVLPGHQRRGIGSQLIRAGLAHATSLGYGFVVVLGEPAYYRRFGFETASQLGLGNEYGVDKPFMTLALHREGLKNVSGLVRYQPEFTTVMP